MNYILGENTFTRLCIIIRSPLNININNIRQRKNRHEQSFINIVVFSAQPFSGQKEIKILKKRESEL